MCLLYTCNTMYGVQCTVTCGIYVIGFYTRSYADAIISKDKSEILGIIPWSKLLGGVLNCIVYGLFIFLWYWFMELFQNDFNFKKGICIIIMLVYCPLLKIEFSFVMKFFFYILFTINYFIYLFNSNNKLFNSNAVYLSTFLYSKKI